MSLIVRRIRRSAASSSGVQAPKSLRRIVRAPDATRPSLRLQLVALLAARLGLGHVEVGPAQGPLLAA